MGSEDLLIIQKILFIICFERSDAIGKSNAGEGSRSIQSPSPHRLRADVRFIGGKEQENK